MTLLSELKIKKKYNLSIRKIEGLTGINRGIVLKGIELSITPSRGTVVLMLRFAAESATKIYSANWWSSIGLFRLGTFFILNKIKGISLKKRMNEYKVLRKQYFSLITCLNGVPLPVMVSGFFYLHKIEGRLDWALNLIRK